MSYQRRFSRLHPEWSYDGNRRYRKARKVIAILKDYAKAKARDLSQGRVLDIGCGAGFMTEIYGEVFQQVYGLDIDEEALIKAKKRIQRVNLSFFLGDGLSLPFPEESLDGIILNHVYEHVPDPSLLMKEVFRVLKKGGWVYFACANRLTLIEPHYRLPFLAWLPKPLAHEYVRLSGKGKYYYENLLTYWGLKKLTSIFKRHDFTKKVVDHPEAFQAEDMLPFHSWKHRFARIFVRVLHPFFPVFLWVLEKP